MEALMSVSENAASPEELLRHAALLAGLGERARPAVDEIRAAMAGEADGGRTCIDAGSPLMIALLAPGGRGLRVLARLAPPAGAVAPWLRFHQLPDGRLERWRSDAYLGETAEAWQRALAAARLVAGGEERLRRYHAALGPRGRIYSVSWSLGSGPPRASVSWQLDRTSPPAEALAACGVGEAWPAAAEVFASLLGQPITPRMGPWSLLLPLEDDAPRVRVGTTRWARSLEDEGKRRRLSTMFTRLGGDGRFAEALYKLVASSGPAGPATRIGRAVELELAGSRPVALEVYLCPTSN
jgi:hypothetical protein